MKVIEYQQAQINMLNDIIIYSNIGNTVLIKYMFLSPVYFVFIYNYKCYG